MNDEEKIKNYIRPILLRNFVVKEEVEGTFLVDRTSVRIDFLLYPKEELIEKGFDQEWIGLEVKSPNTNEPQKKGLQVVWQAITYSQSIFGNIRPMFIAIHPPLEEFFNTLRVYREGIENPFPYNESHLLKCLMQKGNVGTFEINSRVNSWRLVFGAGQSYFNSTSGRSKIKNIGSRRVVGSWK
jgi:hypothetical protein